MVVVLDIPSLVRGICDFHHSLLGTFLCHCLTLTKYYQCESLPISKKDFLFVVPWLFYYLRIHMRETHLRIKCYAVIACHSSTNHLFHLNGGKLFPVTLNSVTNLLYLMVLELPCVYSTIVKTMLINSVLNQKSLWKVFICQVRKSFFKKT